MESATRLHSRSDRFDARDIRPALMELRRKAWETLLDLGLTDEEIAAYYGVEPGVPETVPMAETKVA